MQNLSYDDLEDKEWTEYYQEDMEDSFYKEYDQDSFLHIMEGSDLENDAIDSDNDGYETAPEFAELTATFEAEDQQEHFVQAVQQPPRTNTNHHFHGQFDKTLKGQVSGKPSNTTHDRTQTKPLYKNEGQRDDRTIVKPKSETLRCAAEVTKGRCAYQDKCPYMHLLPLQTANRRDFDAKNYAGHDKVTMKNK